MILKHIKAENILKYRHMELAGLPEHGQIAVAGANEAGKTAIGETICFGLFGRTFSLEPGQLDRVIRWGEYEGSVGLTFTARDGETYTVTRQINNTGHHEACLFLEGEEVPVAEGVEEVACAIREISGFSYAAFVDSFYLAQREMEVPHAKSATVKALIGVDKLEAVQAELHTEMATTAQSILGIEAQIKALKQKVADVGLDRSQLGRLESARDAEAASIATKEAEAAELTSRAHAIGKAASSFIETAQRFVESNARTNFEQWCDRNQCVTHGLTAVATVAKSSGIETEVKSLATTTAAVQSIQHGLTEYEKVRSLATLYRQRLEHLLDESPGAPVDGDTATQVQGDARFAARRARLNTEIDRIKGRRRPLLVLAVFLVEVACLGWAGWILLQVAPESSLATWLAGVIGLTAYGRHLLFLLVALGGSVITALAWWQYMRATSALRQCEHQVESVESEAKTAREEVSVIDATLQAPLPDALNALRSVRNDLLNSAVVSFVEGEGAVLVRSDALSAKLAQIRDGSANAVRSLRQAQQRASDRATEMEAEIRQAREHIALVEEEIAQEQLRWEKVEALEHNVSRSDAQAGDLRRQIGIRKLACELIDGACRRIYSRFHPELRRFVSRILPQLTDDRYEHLEIDDNLHVRVFCKEKNDFVGLAEISNGTHRQLMLCVRLALSQALIASTGKASQFIFFDEPFAFFDEQRMNRAIDVLRRISPQITQVWLAAQRFEQPESFDLHLNCDVENDTLLVAGGARPRKAVRATA